MNEQNNASEDAKNQKDTNENYDAQELLQKIEEAQALQLKLAIEKVRALPPQKVLTPKQTETLFLIEKEELTEDDKKRIAWATLRLPKQRYTGTDYTPTQKKKIKAKRRLTSQSRKANR